MHLNCRVDDPSAYIESFWRRNQMICGLACKGKDKITTPLGHLIGKLQTQRQNMHDRPIVWLGGVTSFKSGEVNLVVWYPIISSQGYYVVKQVFSDAIKISFLTFSQVSCVVVENAEYHDITNYVQNIDLMRAVVVNWRRQTSRLVLSFHHFKHLSYVLRYEEKSQDSGVYHVSVAYYYTKKISSNDTSKDSKLTQTIIRDTIKHWFII